jgi:hypothetical protein
LKRKEKKKAKSKTKKTRGEKRTGRSAQVHTDGKDEQQNQKDIGAVGHPDNKKSVSRFLQFI